MHAGSMEDAHEMHARCIRDDAICMQEAAGSMQEACEKHGMHARCIQDACKMHARSVQDACKKHAGSMQDECGVHAGCMNDVGKNHAISMMEACKMHTRCIRGACKMHARCMRDSDGSLQDEENTGAREGPGLQNRIVVCLHGIGCPALIPGQIPFGDRSHPGTTFSPVHTTVKSGGPSV